MSPGSGSWEALSDVHAKAGFAPVGGHYISIVDQEPVALAAIQELYGIVQKSQIQCTATHPADQALQNTITSLGNRLAVSNLLAAAAVATSILSLWRRKTWTP